MLLTTLDNPPNVIPPFSVDWKQTIIARKTSFTVLDGKAFIDGIERKVVYMLYFEPFHSTCSTRWCQNQQKGLYMLV